MSAIALADVTPQGQRERNRLKLLEALHAQPGSSRAALADRTALSRPTLTALLDELERAGLAERVPEPEDRPRGTGRPAARVALAPRAAYAVGVDVGHTHVRAAVCDLGGELLADAWSAAEVDHAPEASLDLAAALVADVLGEAGADADRVIGVGMDIAAPVDAATGTVFTESILAGWAGLRPADELERRLGLPVQLDNDANAGALGEQTFGAARGAGDVLYVRLSDGIGLGLILAGQAYRGFGGIAGELGHVQAVPDGLVCRCGKRGCLETIAAPARVAARLGSPVADLLARIDAGDLAALEAVAEAGDAVGRALAATVNVLNPALIVVGGDLAAAGERLLEPLRAAVQRDAVTPAATGVRVVAGTLGERAEVLGAAQMMLARAPLALLQRWPTA